MDLSNPYPYLYSTEDVSRFIDAVGTSQDYCDLIQSISLEDRSLTVDAYTSEWPEPSLDEVKTWRSLCKHISVLASKHNLRNLSVAVTACKRIQEDAGPIEGEDCTEPAKAWSEPIVLDRLAMTGCDPQQPDLMRCFRPKETIIYTAGPAWNTVGLPTLIWRTKSATVEIVIGSFPDMGVNTILWDTMRPVRDRRAGVEPLQVLTFRVRQGLPEKEQLKDAVEKIVRARIVDYDIQIKEWQPQATTQLEAERAEWTNGAWLNREPFHADQRAMIKSDESRGWDDCVSEDIILREDIPEPDDVRIFRERMEAALGERVSWNYYIDHR